MNRVLSTELKTYFDSKIGPAGLAAVGLDPVKIMLAAARSAVGITAVNQTQIDLFRGTVAKPCGESWCMDFVQSCIAYAESLSGASSSIPSTELCVGLWNAAKATRRVLAPVAGDIVIWEFGTTIHGHTGFVLGSNSLAYQTVEGNTSGADKIDPNGNGVWLKNRAKGGSKTFVELGFLRPFGDV